jgi:hypothetical protein
MNLARPEQADPAFGIDAHGVVYPGQLPTASFSRTHRALISHGKKMSALSGYRAVRTSRRRCRVTESPSSRQSSEQATGPKASVHVLKLGTALLRSRSSEVRTTSSSEDGRPGTGITVRLHDGMSPTVHPGRSAEQRTCLCRVPALAGSALPQTRPPARSRMLWSRYVQRRRRSGLPSTQGSKGTLIPARLVSGFAVRPVERVDSTRAVAQLG